MVLSRARYEMYEMSSRSGVISGLRSVRRSGKWGAGDEEMMGRMGRRCREAENLRK